MKHISKSIFTLCAALAAPFALAQEDDPAVAESLETLEAMEEKAETKSSAPSAAGASAPVQKLNEEAAEDVAVAGEDAIEDAGDSVEPGDAEPADGGMAGEEPGDPVEAEEDSIESAMSEATRDVEADDGTVIPDPLPGDAEFVPDESLLMDPVDFQAPTYDEIVRRSQEIDQRDYVEPGLDLRQRIALRKAKTKALREPEIQAALETARSEPFHAGQQEAYKNYYEMLYSRIKKIDSSVGELADKHLEDELKEIGAY